MEENVKDEEGRRPGEEDYNPQTLFIPPEEYKKFSNLMRQYWDAKRKHFDKIVAHNMADQYWFYYNDAYVTSKLLDLKIGVHTDGKFYTTFSQKLIYKYAPILLDSGYKIVLVERVSDRYEILLKKGNQNAK